MRRKETTWQQKYRLPRSRECVNKLREDLKCRCLTSMTEKKSRSRSRTGLNSKNSLGYGTKDYSSYRQRLYSRWKISVQATQFNSKKLAIISKLTLLTSSNLQLSYSTSEKSNRYSPSRRSKSSQSSLSWYSCSYTEAKRVQKTVKELERKE